MPLQLPVLDDRDFEQLLVEAKRRIPVHTPEWTNFDVESDPGITIVELFAFLTESLLYRADRIPERSRLKFLQLLGVPLRQAAPASGLVRISNERGPLEAMILPEGVVVSAGNVRFLTREPVTVLPLDAAAYYKRRVPREGRRHEELTAKYEAVLAARLSEIDDDELDARSAASARGAGRGAPAVALDFYETAPAPLPTASDPYPVLDLGGTETIDRAVYLALLAPKNTSPEEVREAIARRTLSVGVVPSLAEEVGPLVPGRLQSKREPLPELVFELADARSGEARYTRLRASLEPDATGAGEVAVFRLQLPGAEALRTWEFAEPMEEGTGDYPPRVEDEQVAQRIVTWIRLRLPSMGEGTPAGTAGAAAGGAPGRAGRAPAARQGTGEGTLNARLAWVGINCVRVGQAVPVMNEQLGTATGEPDQSVALANTPVVEGTLRLEVEDANEADPAARWRLWRQTDDLLAASEAEEVFTVDHESGLIRFGDGLRGRRPPNGSRLRASYETGGGTQGNLAAGAINRSPDVRLQGGFRVENPVPTWGGDEGETPAQGERRIPLYLRHRDRLVTAQDFRDITERTPGVDVGRVEVLPLFRPSPEPGRAPERDAAGVVTVLVVPALDAVRPLWPTPDRLFLQRVCAHLDTRRLLTTEVYVRGPEYVPVSVSAGVSVRAGFFRDEVVRDVTARLEEYLSALPPGGPEEAGWPLAKRLLRKDLEAVVTRVEGVEFVHSLLLGAGGRLNVEEHDMTGLELPLLAAVGVRDGAAEPLESLTGAGGAGGAGGGTTTGGAGGAAEVVPVPVTKTKC